MEWLVILAVVLICPLMHFWMMRKGGHRHEDRVEEKSPKKKKSCH